MNTVDELVESLTPDMVNDLKRAIEIGKFPRQSGRLRGAKGADDRGDNSL